MEQKQEKLYALLNEKLDHTEEISDEEILVEIDKLIWEEAKGQYMPLSEKKNHAQAATIGYCVKG